LTPSRQIFYGSGAIRPPKVSGENVQEWIKISSMGDSRATLAQMQ
jgi:hypothetical protein